MPGKRLALIVATDQYQDPGLRKLRAPSKDAEALAGVLADPELGDFDVDVVRNETSASISERVESLLAAGRPDDLIVLHFSCHGLKDDSGELYLAATNTRPTLLASTAVDAALVNRLMRRSRARRVVLFLDCCYGGAFERGMVPRSTGVVEVGDQFVQRESELEGGRGRAVITASNAMEFAFEGSDLADTTPTQPSIFTGALVEGLATGEADRDQDGMVSLGELYEYVFERVRQESPNQTPGKWEFGLQGELILAKNPQRVVVPVPPRPDVLELAEHPFPATRLGSIEVLSRLAESDNLPAAAGARSVLLRMVNDDSRSVAGAAEEAVSRTTLRLAETEIDLGTVDVGAESIAEVSIEGFPLALASRIQASTPKIRVQRIDRVIRIEADTSVPGPIDGVIAVAGPAGEAEVHVVGVVAALPAQQPGAKPAQPARGLPHQVEAAPTERALAAKPNDPSSAAGTSVPTANAQPASPATLGVTGSTTVARAPATEGAWVPLRTLARAGLGGLLYRLLDLAWFFTFDNPGARQDSFDNLVGINGWRTVVIAAVVAVAVVVAESVIPHVRVPDGRAYGPLRGHRLATASIEGAVACGAVGAAAVGFVYASYVSLGAQDFLIRHPLLGAAGFALAEAAIILVLGRRARTAPSTGMDDRGGS